MKINVQRRVRTAIKAVEDTIKNCTCGLQSYVRNYCVYKVTKAPMCILYDKF
jgi:hypothetical protein